MVGVHNSLSTNSFSSWILVKNYDEALRDYNGFIDIFCSLRVVTNLHKTESWLGVFHGWPQLMTSVFHPVLFTCWFMQELPDLSYFLNTGIICVIRHQHPHLKKHFHIWYNSLSFILFWPETDLKKLFDLKQTNGTPSFLSTQIIQQARYWPRNAGSLSYKLTCPGSTLPEYQRISVWSVRCNTEWIDLT